MATGTSNASASCFDFTMEADTSRDWPSIQFYLGAGAEHLDEGVSTLLTGANLHGLRYDPEYAALLDEAKAVREHARSLRATAYAKSQRQADEAREQREGGR